MRTKEQLAAVADVAERAADSLVVIDDTSAAYYDGVEAALRWATGGGATAEIEWLVEGALIGEGSGS